MREVRFNLLKYIEGDETEPVKVSKGLKVLPLEYGFQVADEEYSEWAITVLFTCRQDSRTSWSVSLVTVDGTINVRNGLTPTVDLSERIESEIADLTGGWLPQYRINSLEDDDD